MIGSLLLGLYDDDHTLHHVGVAAAFTATMRKELVVELAPLRADALEDHPWRDWAVAQEEASATGQRLPGATSRWNRGKDLSWEPLRPDRLQAVLRLVLIVPDEIVEDPHHQAFDRVRRFLVDRHAGGCVVLRDLQNAALLLRKRRRPRGSTPKAKHDRGVPIISIISLGSSRPSKLSPTRSKRLIKDGRLQP